MGNVQQHVGKVATIGRYEVEVVKYLGEGGSSFIFLVRSTSATIGGQMVLKRLLADSEASYQLIESEIRMHERFKHAQVVEFLAAHTQRVPGRNGQREVFILMEYCPNGHLHDNMLKMGEKRFSESELLRTFRSLCVPVLALHHAEPPVAHRDLKLENFLLAKSGVYKLCDFGSCVEGPQSLRTKQDRAREAEHVLKRTTAMYRSPELADVEGTAMFGAGELTEAVDVWAMGCVLFTMAFFKQPFPPEGLRTDKYAVPATSPYSPDVHTLIARMLTADVDKRATLDHVVDCIDALLKGKPLPPTSGSRPAVAAKTDTPAPSSSSSAKPSSGKAVEARKEAITSIKPAAVDLLGMDFDTKAAGSTTGAPVTVSVDALAANFADFANFPSPTSASATTGVTPSIPADPFAQMPGLVVPQGKHIDAFGFPVSPVKQQQAAPSVFGFGAAPIPAQAPHQSMMASASAAAVDPFEALATPPSAMGMGYGHGYGGAPHGQGVPMGSVGTGMQMQQQMRFGQQSQQQHMQQGWGGSGFPRSGGF